MFFAKVVHGQVTEYPVTDEEILTRTVPPEWYTPCEVQDVSNIGIDQEVEQYFEVTTDLVKVKYHVREITEDNLIARLKSLRGEHQAQCMAALKLRLKRWVTQCLDDLAKARDYEDFATLASYVVSKNTTWFAEAQYATDCRDNLWAEVYALHDLMDQNPLGIPDEFSELLSTLTIPTWDNFTA